MKPYARWYWERRRAHRRFLLSGAIPPISYDPDAEAYFTAAGVTDTTEKDEVNAFIVGAKEDGFWSKFARLAILAGSTEAISLRDVRDPTKIWLAPNSPTHTPNRGVQGDGSTAYLSANESYGTSGIYTQDSATIGAWCNLQGVGGTAVSHIGRGSGVPTARVTANSAAGNETFIINDGTSSTGRSGTLDRTGHRTATRTGPSIKRFFFNGVRTANLTVASTGLPPNNALGLRNETTYSPDRLAVLYFGSGFSDTDVANLHARLVTLLTARGAA